MTFYIPGHFQNIVVVVVVVVVVNLEHPSLVLVAGASEFSEVANAVWRITRACL